MKDDCVIELGTYIDFQHLNTDGFNYTYRFIITQDNKSKLSDNASINVNLIANCEADHLNSEN